MEQPTLGKHTRSHPPPPLRPRYRLSGHRSRRLRRQRPNQNLRRRNQPGNSTIWQIPVTVFAEIYWCVCVL